MVFSYYVCWFCQFSSILLRVENALGLDEAATAAEDYGTIKTMALVTMAPGSKSSH